jgi:hypothetical protein
MSIKEQDLTVQTKVKISPRAHFLMSDGSEVEIFVDETDGGGTSKAVAWAEWRGQHWSADGETGDIAMRTLIERLHRRDPSYMDG